MISKATRKKLPRATLIWFEWAKPILPNRPIFQRNRLANAMRLRIGSLVLILRMPWLEHSARTLHPELFGDQS